MNNSANRHVNPENEEMMMDEGESMAMPQFELVRLLHKTKLRFNHEFDPTDNYLFNTNLLAKYFDPDNYTTFQDLYLILKSMSYKSEIPIPYSQLLKLFLEIPKLLPAKDFQKCSNWLCKMLKLTASKVFKSKKRSEVDLIHFEIACQALSTELIGYRDTPGYQDLTIDSFNINTALNHIEMQLYSSQESREYPMNITRDNVDSVHYVFFRLHLSVIGSKNALQHKPYGQEVFFKFWSNYLLFIQKFQTLSETHLKIVNDLLVFMNRYFRGKVEPAGSKESIICLRRIVDLIYQKTKDFSKDIAVVRNDPLLNLSSLLIYLKEINILDDVCLDEAALAVQKCISLITKNPYESNFFSQSGLEVREEFFLLKIAKITEYLDLQKKSLNITCSNLLFFTSSMQYIKDPNHKASIISSAAKLSKEEQNEIRFHLKVLSGPLTLVDVASIVDAFLNQTLPKVSSDAFVELLVSSEYSKDLSERTEESLFLIKSVYEKSMLEKLMQVCPAALKFLFMLSFKLDQETILSLREDEKKNIYFDIISLFEESKRTDQILSLLKLLVENLDGIFKNRQGLHEESVAGIFEYLNETKNRLHEVKEEWEQMSSGKDRLSSIIEFSEIYNLFYIILLYPLEIERIQQSLIGFRKKDSTGCRYTRIPYCCPNCGKKTKEYLFLFRKERYPNLQCSACDSHIPIYTLRCAYTIEMDPEMRSYITNTAESFQSEFKSKLATMKKLAIKNSSDLTSLNSIITQLEPLILTHFEHLSDQIKLPSN